MDEVSCFNEKHFDDRISITVEFMYICLYYIISHRSPDNLPSGGLELLFSNQRKHEVSLPTKCENNDQANIAFLVRFLCENIMSSLRKDMLLSRGTV